MIAINTQSSIKISDDKVYYFDPFQIKDGANDADYIFITHDHFDHFDRESILKVIKENTTIIVPEYLTSEALSLTNNVIGVVPDSTYTLNVLNFKTTYSYNINKSFHPKDKGNVGYLINIGNTSYYIPGDTDVLEENYDIDVDVAFIPIGGTYTMNYMEAAEYINKIKPRKCIPIHYGSIVGDITLGEDFKKLIDNDIKVELYLKKEGD